MDRSTSGGGGEDRSGGAPRAGARAGAFLRGILLGALLSLAGVALLIMLAPPPTDLPRSGRVEVVQPPATQAEAEAESPAVVVVEQPVGAPAIEQPAEAAATGDAAAPEPAAATVPAAIEQPAEAAATGDAAAPEPAAATVPADAPEPGAEAPAEPVVVAIPQEPSDAPAGGESPEAQGARENGAAALQSAAAPDGSGAAPAAAGAAPETAATGALAANARAFEAPRRAPLMSVVLVGRGADDLSAERLELMTMPLTVAIPPEDPRAAELGAAARAAGHEVLVDISAAGDPAAAEQLATLDMAVGATATSGAAGTDALAPMLEQLAQQGFAWVESGSGIGAPAQRVARDSGVAFTRANRVVPDDASPEQIYQAIDAAARQARRSGVSVLFLDASEPAMQALVRWGMEQQGEDTVWFAPISAVIQRRGAL